MVNRVSNDQLDVLLNFLAEHPSLARGVGQSPRSKGNVEKQWNDLARRLNSFGSGSSKTGDRWKKYWADLKHKSKTRLAKWRMDAQSNGGGLEEKSDIDKKILAIVGVQAMYGDSQHRVPVVMPLTPAEKSKRYREKLKTSYPEKYEETKKKSIERALKSYKRKVVDMTAEEQREELRKKWRALKNINKNNQHTEQPTTSTLQNDIPNIQPEVQVTAPVQPDNFIVVSEVVLTDASESPEPVADLIEVQIQQASEPHQTGLESPVSQHPPARCRRRLRHYRTSLNSNSSTYQLFEEIRWKQCIGSNIYSFADDVF